MDFSRHILHFNPQLFKDRIDVIGAGAVGSKIALELAKLGITTPIHVWDGDVVEAHNLPNQAFYLEDIGKPKVEAIAEHVLLATGTVLHTHKQFLTEPTRLGRVVFLAVDTMEHRKKIFEASLKNKFSTEFVIETRMGIEELRIYGFNPNVRDDIINWENTLVDDVKTVESACGAKTTVGATASITAAMAVTRFISWANSQPHHFEQVVMLRPLITIAN